MDTDDRPGAAINVAALAAANDLSRIVIEDKNFGLVGLADSFQVDCDDVARATASDSSRHPPVVSINTLLGSIEHDLIVADSENDLIRAHEARLRYRLCLETQKHLVEVLQAATKPNGTGKDARGKIVNPTADAIAAYNACCVQVPAIQASTLVPDSLRLRLGYIRAEPRGSGSAHSANASAPLPNFSMGQILSDPDKVVSYRSRVLKQTFDFVFANLGSGASIVKGRRFLPSVAALPYSTPTAVKVEACDLLTTTRVMSIEPHGQKVETGLTTVPIIKTAVALAAMRVDE
jgi:hypothetical protein